MKPNDNISTYNVDFMYYAFKLCWRNSMLCHRYYQGLSNQIQDSISIQEQGKAILFQDVYTSVMTINYCYWEHDHKYHHTRQAEKEALESYSQK